LKPAGDALDLAIQREHDALAAGHFEAGCDALGSAIQRARGHFRSRWIAKSASVKRNNPIVLLTLTPYTC
jgi:hypothetical protein